MALVPLPEHPAGLLGRYAARYSRKQFDGLVVDPVKAGSNHAGVLMAHGAEETVVAKKWTKLDRELRWLALMRVSQVIGCSWCTDYGYFDGVTNGMDPAKIRPVATWRSSRVNAGLPATSSAKVARTNCGPRASSPPSARIIGSTNA